MERPWNRTKIVCTIGPASADAGVLDNMMAAGMDLARLNLSHGTHEDHGRVIERLREVSKSRGAPLAVLLDLQGPRIRIGRFRDGKALLEKGREFTISVREVEGTSRGVSTSYHALVKDVREGDRILLADGKIELVVKSVDGDDVRTEVLTGGMLSDNKGMNIPKVSLSTRTITEKDVEDIRFGVSRGVDYIALSFTRTAGDLREARGVVESMGASIPIIAKIERPEALDDLDAIIEASDGIMVARGDLGVELPLEDVPLVQKEIIKAANRAGIPVITATQMLASMTANPRPTRAETSDVANAILDGTDAVMLSEETAAGRFPVEAVTMMSKIADRVEGHIPVYRMAGPSAGCMEEARTPVAVGDAVPKLADESGACLICALTRSGRTALNVSKNRPRIPILGMTTDEKTFRKMNLYWGVEPVLVEKSSDLSALTTFLNDELKKREKASPGDRIIIVAGFPFNRDVHSNMLLVHQII
jgi:pyruvate kinase